MLKFITLSVLALALSTGFASAQSNVDNLCEQAATCAKNGNYQQAQGLLLEALKLQPNNETVAVGLAFVSNLAKDYDTAIAAGMHVLNKINSQSALAFREVGWAYALKAAAARKSGDTANAQEFAKLATGCLVKSLQLNKSDKATWEYLIAHCDACGDTATADQARKTRQQVLGS